MFGGARLLTSLRQPNFAPLPRLARMIAPPANRSFTSPNQIEDFAFEWPVFDSLAKSFSDWILLNIEPFLRVILAVAHAMMPAARLKLPLCAFVFQSELALPIGNPSFNRELQIVWRAEAMKVVRHKQIITHQPSFRFGPSLVNKLVRGFVDQPRVALLGCYGEKNKVGPAKINVNTG
jgi:hypothetical protein